MEILLYLLKSSLVLMLFLACYRFLLSRDTFYAFNRHFLGVGLISSFVVPGIIFTREVLVAAPDLSQFTTVAIAGEEVMPTAAAFNFDLWQIGLLIYLVGALSFSTYFLYQLVHLYLYLNKQDFYAENGLLYIKIAGISAPFSFLNYIVYDPQAHNGEELKMILEHEQAHAKQRHSIDVLLGRLCCALLWFNPLCWLYFRCIEENLEYLADASVQADKYTSRSYQMAILNTATGSSVPPFAQTFYKSFIKKRIIMLNTVQSKSSNRLKALALLPFLAIFLWSFNVKEELHFISNSDRETSKTSYPVFTLTQNSTPDEINEITAYFRKNIEALNIEITVEKRDTKQNILMFDFKTKFARGNEFQKRFTRASEGPFNPYKIQYLGTGKLMISEMGKDGQDFLITRTKMQMAKHGEHNNFGEKSTSKTLKFKDKAFRLEISPKTTETEMQGLAVQLKEQFNVQFKYSQLTYDASGLITAINLEMKDLRNKNVSKLNLKNEEGLGSIIMFRSEEGTLGFTTGSTSSSTTTNSMTSNTISGTGSITEQSNSESGKMQALLAQERALEAQAAALEVQREAIEQQRVHMEKQRAMLEIKRKEMEDRAEVLIGQKDSVANEGALHSVPTVGNQSATQKLPENVLYFVNGKEITQEEMNLIDPNTIESVNVVKDSEELKKYGDKAKNGVIEVTLKKGENN
ncbi:M56 family metallopeptidase [Flavimarina sp. Hel_I_48]|uniref:M56 family metallopeptidase n=1 Tax=Flavimarina sp. Hel_I_48 TaxID=1392488 RepID=UPI0004DF8F19|nr:M56 family metallopeptidase [Flavimarina sp. Hel_I_48]